MAVNEYEIKKQICDIGKRIYDRNMVAANDGNISVKLNDNEFLCTPTGVSKGFMTSGVHLQGRRKRKPDPGQWKFPSSSEIKMHMRVYEKRPDVGARGTCASELRHRICHRRHSADPADYAGGCYRVRLCAHRGVRHAVHHGDPGQC